MNVHKFRGYGPDWDLFLQAIPPGLLEEAAWKQCKAGALICLRESPVEHIHMVLEGTVTSQNVTSDGKVSNWLNMPAPTFVGELEVMAEQKLYATSVTAVTDCTLAYWPIERFMAAAIENPALLLLFSRILAKKNYFLSVNRGYTAFRSSLERTVLYLLQCCDAVPRQSGETVILRKTRSEMTGEIFFSLKTLERCLYRLRDAGALSIVRGKVTINSEQMARLREFRDDPGSI